METDSYLDFFEYLNTKYAIPGEVTNDLRECLSRLLKTDLDDIARHYEIPRKTRLKKEELINRLFETIAYDAELERKLLITSGSEWDFWREIGKTGVAKDNRMSTSRFLWLKGCGLIFSFFKDGEVSFVVPDQIRLAYRRLLSQGLEERRNQYKLVDDYTEAVTSLYGACGINSLYDTISEQNDVKMEYGEFLHILMEYAAEVEDYAVYNGFVIDSMLEEDGYEGFDALIGMRGSRPLVKLPKEELLEYAGDVAYERMPEYQKLSDFLTEKMGIGREMADDLVSELAFYLSMDIEFDPHFELFAQRKLKFTDIRQAADAVGLIVILDNALRKWVYGGYTANEIEKSGGEPAPKHVEFRISNAVLEKPIKPVGRNDPCPCGSGKKYKRCCGGG